MTCKNYKYLIHFSCLLIHLILFSSILYAEVYSDKSKNNANSSYAMVGCGKEFSYFIAPGKSKMSTFITSKFPLNNMLGIEAGYCYYLKPAADYSVGTNVYSNHEGNEEYHDIRINLLYYFWFLKNIQFKMGVNYSKFITGYFLNNPALVPRGKMISMYRNLKKNFLSLNIGLNVDYHVYRYFYLITSIGYRYFFSDNITQKGTLNFSLGLGIRLFSFKSKNKNNDLFSYNIVKKEIESPPYHEKNKKALFKNDKFSAEKTEIVLKSPPVKSSIEKIKTSHTPEKTEIPLLKDKPSVKVPEKPLKSSPVKSSIEKIKTSHTPEKTEIPLPKDKPKTENKKAILNTIPQDIKIKVNYNIFSPDNDKVRDTITFSPEFFDSTNIKEWKLIINNTNNVLIKEFKGKGKLNQISWNGVDKNNNLILPKKKFYYSFSIKNKSGKEYTTKSQFFKTDYYLIKTNHGFLMNIKPIEFDFNKSTIKSENYAILNKAILILKAPCIKNRNIEVKGYTDNQGAEERNKILSKERAKVIFNYLIQKGINSYRLTYKGFGETQPIASNETEEGKQKNRRAEIIILKFK